MVNERFLIDLFRASFPPHYCHSFREKQFCEVLFTLKVSGYFFLARSLMSFPSNFEEGDWLSKLLAFEACSNIAYFSYRFVTRRLIIHPFLNEKLLLTTAI